MAIVPTDEDELSTLTETSLHISTSSDVTKCRDDLILPPSLPLHEKSSFTNSNHEENFEYNKMDESSSSSSSSSIYPYDEPQPSATCTGVPGFPDFAWNNDSNDDNRNGVQERSNTGDGITTTTTTTNAGLSNWEARRRLDSILAASSLGSVTRRNHHQQQQRRRLERLRRKAVNMNKNIMTVRTTDSHSRHPFIMMEDDTDCRAVVVWKPKPYHTRGQQSCHQITKNNWIRKTKRSAVKYKGWRRQQQQQQQQRFHRSARLETIAEHESEGKTNNIINTSRLGLEERFRFKREQHDLLDLQTGMKYLGL
ncbi:hypothetical protein IV203_019814 [Nitzschia inconspicua]|uniref:Uncharacterized protein n=1 Tax=Nitzschia inconspicua TaxID=303405 RepID=A0A9K3LZZ4_9STRA|nr:hypothetical protein IV203_020383 [Nitzschia inconspicua]KAG7371244.1 hypothetical protein IV203_019814 [Nitzschia inconspicua]